MFQFKQFTIHQDHCAMKVGTDGVLLGAWAPNHNATHILDIGTGTGLIALMLAQRTSKQNTSIHALEIDENAAQQAAENIAASPFHNRVTISHEDIVNHTPHHPYSHIVCNPPFFINSLKCSDNQRNTARHTDTLSFGTLIQQSLKLLTPNGSLSVIIPFDSSAEFVKTANDLGFQLSHHTHIYPTPKSGSPKRSLLHFIKKIEPTTPIITKLTIELSRHVYTPEYIALTQAFYLKM